MELALEADVSTRHLSFVETGRSTAQPRDGRSGSPSTSTCRCASATSCCWPPATRPPTRRRPLDDAGDGAGPRGGPPGARRPRALPGGRRRPPLEAAWTATPASRCCSTGVAPRAARAAGQRAAAEPAPRRPWRRGSPTSASGARTSCDRLRRQVAAHRRPAAAPRCWPSSRPTRATSREPRDAPAGPGEIVVPLRLRHGDGELRLHVARSRPSARRWTSPSPSCRSRPSSRPTPTPRRLLRGSAVEAQAEPVERAQPQPAPALAPVGGGEAVAG